MQWYCICTGFPAQHTLLSVSLPLLCRRLILCGVTADRIWGMGCAQASLLAFGALATVIAAAAVSDVYVLQLWRMVQAPAAYHAVGVARQGCSLPCPFSCQTITVLRGDMA